MASRLIRQAVLSFFTAVVLMQMGVSAGPITRRYTVTNVKRQEELICNGHAALCDRPYGNTTFLTSHDSFAYSQLPIALSRTQEVDLNAQLEMGVRALQAQGRLSNGKLHFCHTSCSLFDGGSVEDYLKTVKAFLDQNPNEVITFIFTNPENLSVEEVWKPVFESSGISSMAYIPIQPIMSRDDWPTLRELIQSGKRVIVFLDQGADKRAEPEKEYILPQFKMMWEDPYNPTDPNFPCKVDRTDGPLLPTQQLNLMNHNLNVNILPVGRGLRIPDRINTPRYNGAKSIYDHAQECAAIMDDKAPNFVLLDFVNVGQGMAAVDKLNGFEAVNGSDGGA